ncbi:heterokaryon incompatibility protein-domain-containing protein [Lophiotrema nucula]|uniref:Heterokaryon incompatibility protein-domain-containing protein n=1 Tax=Lophiotrema nucula TaxID=690887 RepID=A0A6A5YXI6_9PLEO|nr:heterokaryon incompatibility protein-domain-containing protein [Lophiotrema nucula]
MRPYVYRSLETDTRIHAGRGISQRVSIRLLELLPGDAGTELSCKLLHKPLSDRVAYEALSYTWGSPDRTHQVICDGSYVQVTGTLREALTTLRLTRRKRMLWIDQLCIDQENVKEREDQVRVMHLIYKRAARTIVFLGSGDAPALDLRMSRWRLLRDVRRAYSHGESDLIKEVGRLFAHPWFQRVWILQEIGMSNVQKVVCYYKGSTLTWDAIRGAATYLGSYSPGHKYDFIQLPLSVVRHTMLMAKWTAMGPGSSQFPTLDRYGHLYHSGNKLFYSFFLLSMEPRLTEALQDSRFCLATDPRDKVYSLLNMLNIDPLKDKLAWLLHVDYSLPVAEVYSRATRYSIETERSLEIICYKEGASNFPDLPSWVPDWTHQRLFPIHRIALPTHFRCQFHSKAWPVVGAMPALRSTMNTSRIASFSTDGQRMILTGHKLDIIDTLSSPWSASLEVGNDDLFENWANVYTGGRASEITGLSFKPERKPRGLQVSPHSICDFWLRVGRHSRLMTSDVLRPFHSKHPAQKEWRRSAYHRHRRGRTLILHRKGNLAFLFYCDWLAMMLPYASVGRRVATTRDGYFLLVPTETRKGDHIYFLEGGGSLGYVLRNMEGPDGFEFIGTAYVHGFYGTKLKWQERSTECITIR